MSKRSSATSSGSSTPKAKRACKGPAKMLLTFSAETVVEMAEANGNLDQLDEIANQAWQVLESVAQAKRGILKKEETEKKKLASGRCYACFRSGDSITCYPDSSDAEQSFSKMFSRCACFDVSMGYGIQVCGPCIDNGHVEDFNHCDLCQNIICERDGCSTGCGNCDRLLCQKCCDTNADRQPKDYRAEDDEDWGKTKCGSFYCAECLKDQKDSQVGGCDSCNEWLCSNRAKNVDEDDDEFVLACLTRYKDKCLDYCCSRDCNRCGKEVCLDCATDVNPSNCLPSYVCCDCQKYYAY